MSVAPVFKFKTVNGNEKLDYAEIEQCINNVIKNEGFVRYNVEENIHPPDGGSFLGIHMDLNIKGETDTKTKEVNLFLKTIGKDQSLSLLSLHDVYKTELFVYCELSQIFKELENEVCLQEDKRYNMIKAYDLSNPSVVILENMAMKGYKSKFSTDCMTLTYAEVAVRELAKFHALSFILRVKRPDYFERKIKTLKHVYNINDDFKSYINNMCQKTLVFLDGDTKKKFEMFIPTIVEKLSKYWTTHCGRDVLCHGDCRPNNILIKEINGEIKDVILIDYQIVFYGCPILDLLYLIFPATDRNFRKTNLRYVFDIYYDSLQMFLSYFDLDVSEIYPKEEFERHLKESLDYGFMTAVHMLPVLMANKDEIPDITRKALAEINLSSHVDDFRERMVELVEDFIEWGYL